MKNKIFNNKRCISEITSLVLLLAVLSVVGIIVYMWGIGYTQNNIEQYKIVQEHQISINFFNSSTLYVKSISPISFNFTKILIDDTNCGISGKIYANNLTVIDIGSCTSGMTSGPKEVIIYSNNGVFTEVKNLLLS